MKSEIIGNIPAIIDTFDKAKLSTKVILALIFIAIAPILIFVYILKINYYRV